MMNARDDGMVRVVDATENTLAKTILLVEDNSMVRRSIETTLQSLGYRVLAFASGQLCLEGLKGFEEAVALLITDAVMPEMSGRELIERVRALRPTVPVLLMSGYDQSTLASRNGSTATDYFLQKPFDHEDLVAVVRQATAAADPLADESRS